MILSHGWLRKGSAAVPPAHWRRVRIPYQVLAVSFAALVIPVLDTLTPSGSPTDLAFLLWLLALVPVFVLAYYRGWPGAVTALAVAGGVLFTTHALGGELAAGATYRSGVHAVALIVVATGLAVGWLAELLHRSRFRAEELALTDELTGLPNRRHVCVVLDHDFAAAQRGRPLTVVLFDLDRFKKYNDDHGHAAGDEALRLFADMLTSVTRRMNTAGRFGGEEFLAVLSETDLEESLVFVDRVLRHTRSLNLPLGSLTVSAGVAAYHPSMATPGDLVAAADQAMYRAKAAGGDQVRVDASWARLADVAVSR
jgi:diguanylate cyclase (GGDEF)-like protein